MNEFFTQLNLRILIDCCSEQFFHDQFILFCRLDDQWFFLRFRDKAPCATSYRKLIINASRNHNSAENLLGYNFRRDVARLLPAGAWKMLISVCSTLLLFINLDCSSSPPPFSASSSPYSNRPLTCWSAWQISRIWFSKLGGRIYNRDISLLTIVRRSEQRRWQRVFNLVKKLLWKKGRFILLF